MVKKLAVTAVTLLFLLAAGAQFADFGQSFDFSGSSDIRGQGAHPMGFARSRYTSPPKKIEILPKLGKSLSLG